MLPTADAVASSLETLNQHYRAITHNLANASTTGYKRLCRSAEQLYAARPFAESAEPVTGEVADRTSIDFNQGGLVRTGRPLDLALHGSGFFVIETPEGPRYTRNGVFCVSPTGQLVDGGGRTVSGEGGPITLPEGASEAQVSVASGGEVSAGTAAIGRLRIVQFDDPQRLEPVGGNLFSAPEGVDPAPATKTTVQQGFQEASNVNVVEELVDLIVVSRLYEANLKSVQVQDERMQNLLRVVMA